jgi:GDP-mannose transporter
MFILAGEYSALQNPLILTYSFMNLNFFAGVMGVTHNFASLWCVGATGATTYAIVGSLCKIPLTILGFILFDVPVTNEGMAFIALGTLGGLLYGWSKLPPFKA